MTCENMRINHVPHIKLRRRIFLRNWPCPFVTIDVFQILPRHAFLLILPRHAFLLYFCKFWIPIAPSNLPCRSASCLVFSDSISERALSLADNEGCVVKCRWPVFHARWLATMEWSVPRQATVSSGASELWPFARYVKYVCRSTGMLIATSTIFAMEMLQGGASPGCAFLLNKLQYDVSLIFAFYAILQDILCKQTLYVAEHSKPFIRSHIVEMCLLHIWRSSKIRCFFVLAKTTTSSVGCGSCTKSFCLEQSAASTQGTSLAP